MRHFFVEFYNSVALEFEQPKTHSTLLSQNEARMQNHKEVVEEDKRNKLPSNWESRKRQAEWIMQDEAARKEAETKVQLITHCSSSKLFVT